MIYQLTLVPYSPSHTRCSCLIALQASAIEVSELASRKFSWKKSYAGLQNWLKPIVDPPASQPGRWTSWAAPRPVKKKAATSQPADDAFASGESGSKCDNLPGLICQLFWCLQHPSTMAAMTLTWLPCTPFLTSLWSNISCHRR